MLIRWWRGPELPVDCNPPAGLVTGYAKNNGALKVVNYELLVTQQGWTLTQPQRWVGDLIERDLFGTAD